MNKKLGMALCMIAGAFLIYCGGNAINTMTGDGGTRDGFVKDAMGQMGGSCCTQPAQTFTKLAEGDLSATAQSPPISVGTYREVIVYVSNVSNSSTDWLALFRPDAAAQVGGTGQIVAINYGAQSGARLRVDGNDLVLQSRGTAGHYVVAGVQ